MTLAVTAAVASVGVGIAGINASKDASKSAAAGNQAAIDAQNQQFEQTRSDLLPFLDAARGQEGDAVFDENGFNVARNQYNDAKRNLNNLANSGTITQQQKAQFINELGAPPTNADFTTRPLEGGALQQFQEGINQAPDVPTIQQFGGQAVRGPSVNLFNGQAVQSPELLQAGQLQDLRQFGGRSVNAPRLEQFTGRATQAPGLQQFSGQAPDLEQLNFDPQTALDSPALQFQQEQGQRQVDRVAGKNRQLGSGQRLIDAAKFGQGLASQSLNDEFNRQLTGVNQRNQAAQQGFGNQVQANQLQNQIAGQQFGLNSQQLQQGVDLNQLRNQTAQQGFGNQGQQLGQDININQLQNQIAQQGIGNRNNQTILANQVSGQQFGLDTQRLSQQQNLNQLGNQQRNDQTNLNRQFLGDQLNLSNVNQNRLLQQFGLRNDQFQQRQNALAGLVDVGARTGGSLASAGAQNAGNVSSLINAQGQTNAAGQLGRANIVGGVVQQGIGAAAQFGSFNQPNQQFQFEQANNFQGDLPFGPQPIGPQ